ncbi:hypothetical protein DFH09DRAFT_1097315 [Mycena vulgaris]|nr:hypothetical protein DFH09DRAFT_1097315 [Mycena vulgaris]
MVHGTQLGETRIAFEGQSRLSCVAAGKVAGRESCGSHNADSESADDENARWRGERRCYDEATVTRGVAVSNTLEGLNVIDALADGIVAMITALGPRPLLVSNGHVSLIIFCSVWVRKESTGTGPIPLNDTESPSAQAAEEISPRREGHDEKRRASDGESRCNLVAYIPSVSYR